MRRIDDMLRMISLDELNGGVTMKDKNTYTVIPEAEAAPKITERKQAAAVKSRKASFAVAAGAGDRQRCAGIIICREQVCDTGYC